MARLDVWQARSFPQYQGKYLCVDYFEKGWGATVGISLPYDTGGATVGVPPLPLGFFFIIIIVIFNLTNLFMG